jgi:hypothetical protein
VRFSSSSNTGANLQSRAHGWCIVNAGAERVAHKANEQAVTACEPKSMAPGRRRGPRPLKHRNTVVVVQVLPLERRRIVGVRVTASGDALVIGSVVP